MENSTVSIKDRINCIQEKIENACQKSGRKTEDVKLLAVSKFHSAQEIEQAYLYGLKSFGENRVQEACEKFPSLLEKYADMHLHLIGSLQRNKVKQIVPYVSCIQSVDRLELVQEIQKRLDSNSLAIENSSINIPSSPLEILFEYHTGEESKSGYTTKDDVFKSLDFILDLQNSKGTQIVPKGFMTMAPFTDDEKAIHKSFQTLRELKDETQKRYPMFDFSCLSMGMSNDFEIAIEEGSNMVRIGTAIFGERQYK